MANDPNKMSIGERANLNNLKRSYFQAADRAERFKDRSSADAYRSIEKRAYANYMEALIRTAGKK